MIGQTANILQYLGPRLGLVPKDQASRLWVHQMQLTVTDWVAEVGMVTIRSPMHFTMKNKKTKRKNAHPISLRCASQNFSATMKRYCRKTAKPLPTCSEKRFVTSTCRYFKWSRDCATLFPAPWQKWHRTIPRAIALHDRVAARPRIKKYLASPRRLAFNTNGIFRHYPELDE